MIPNNIIQDAADCSIRQFEKCAFGEKYKVLLIEGTATDEDLKTAFEFIYSQYVDYAGLYQTHEFELSAYISSLDTRIQTMKRFVDLQLKFILEFGVPYVDGFVLIEKYGHKLYWDHENPDIEGFKKRLAQIGTKDKKYESIVDGKIKELIEFRKKRIKKEFTLLESRKEFITMMNRLQQQRFPIDRDKTTVEDLALAIKDSKDQAEETRMQNAAKKQ